MTDSGEDAHPQSIERSCVIPAPKRTLQSIFGTSKVFLDFDEEKIKASGFSVPQKVKEYCSQGHKSLEQEDWESAVLFFSRALCLDPQQVDFYALRAEAFLQLCDFSSAAQNLRRAYDFQPENTKYLERLTFVLYLQGQCLFEQCDFLDALNIFSQASELQPQKPCFRYRCMACLLALKQHQDCLSLISKEVKQGTATADVYILRARIHNFFQKPKHCYHDLRSALVLDPKHPQARVLLQMMVDQAQHAHQDAGILAVQGKLQHALQCINTAIQNNPLDPRFFLFRGTIYRRLQEFDAAVEDFLKALDMVTNTQDDMVKQAQRQLLLAYNDFAVHCYTQGAYQEAVLLLNKALREEQGEKGLYINRGDCFFQLGNLAFAEADYKQALALSPQDEGANMRMGMLQGKMGFCEHRHRQFQKAVEHFSVAIKHNPTRAQYYLYRAKSRQLLQDALGARQDVTTALLLNPNQPKLFPLLTSLFPGMSVEEVLNTQVAQLARLQLERMESEKTSCPQGLVGLLRVRELERQKARTLRLSWKLDQPTPEESQATPQDLQVRLEGSEEKEAFKEDEVEEKEEVEQELTPHKATSLSDSYLDQPSSGSVFSIRTIDDTDSGTSAIFREYRSTSSTLETFADSSHLQTQSEDSRNNRENLGLSQDPRKSQTSRKSQASQQQHHSSSKTKASLSQRQNSIRTEAAQGHSQSSSKTKATQGPTQRPRKNKATEIPRQRCRKAKAACDQCLRLSKANALQGQTSNMTSCDPCWDLDSAKKTQGQKLSKAEAGPSWSSSSSQVDATWGLSPSLSRTKTTQSQSSSPDMTKAAQTPATSCSLKGTSEALLDGEGTNFAQHASPWSSCPLPQQ
ncbi:tetratricopeptide repeat protein 16 isoform X1 [Castor canadensis]|uniref:Tetratricopeptide repeat protein 16 isoform X1 n=3 Tax=Castor canadensis TaxID=51338 RepID=A0AC58KWE4_CASCN